jgi:hypothetical protein
MEMYRPFALQIIRAIMHSYVLFELTFVSPYLREDILMKIDSSISICKERKPGRLTPTERESLVSGQRLRRWRYLTHSDYVM